MKFGKAMKYMRSGRKVKRESWSGYWFMVDNEIFIHTKDGEVLNIRDVDDMDMVLSNTLASDWEVI